jgi:hypothetical protein
MKRFVIAPLIVSAISAGCDSTTNRMSAPTPTLVGLTLAINTVGDRSGLARTWGYQATATARYSDSSAQDVTNTATWTSSNPAIARISPTGTITGEGPGVTEIRAMYQGFASAVHFCLETDCF